MKQVVLAAVLILAIALNSAYAETTNDLLNEVAKKSPQPVYNFGAAAAWLTRIIRQENRSNFVLRDFFPGAFFSTELHDIPNAHFVIPEVRVAAYYPLVSKFNDVRQANRPLDIGVDFFAGVRFEFAVRFFKFSAGPGLHMFYMSSARWHYFNMGGALAAGVEFAFSPKWSIVIDGFASIDSGNLGGNKEMEPFDITYQYQTSIGARYSKRALNQSPIFTPKEKPAKEKRNKKNNETLNYNTLNAIKYEEEIIQIENTLDDSEPNDESYQVILDR